MRVKTSIALVAGGFIAVLLMTIPQYATTIIYGTLPKWWWGDANSQFGRIFGLIGIITVLGLSHLIYRVAKTITPWISEKLDENEVKAVPR